MGKRVLRTKLCDMLGIIHEIKPARMVLEEMVEEAVEILTKKLPGEVKAE